MRITESVLTDACKEINNKLEKNGHSDIFSVRPLSGGGSGRLVEVTTGKLTAHITTIDESNRAVFAYLQGIDDALHNYGKPGKTAKAKENLVSLKYKTEGGSVFNNLFTRCLNHEFDLSVSLEHVIYLSSDIDEAKNQLDIGAYEYGRLLEQYKMTVGVATTQAKEGVRPHGDLSKFDTK